MASHLKKAALLGAVSLTLAGTCFADTYRYSHFLPEPFPLNDAERYFVEEMKKRTNGEIDIQITFGSALGGQKEILDFVSGGVVEMASVPANHYVSQLPAYEVFGMSLLWESPAEVVDVYKETITTIPEAKAGYDALGVTPFMFRGFDPYVMLCNKPVATIDDMQGLKVRTFGSVLPKVFDELGAIPVNTTSGEIYEAMQRGTVDCAYFSRIAHLIFKIHEVSKYEIDFEFGSIGAYLSYISTDVLNSWTEAQRETFRQVNAEAEAKAAGILAAVEKKAKSVFAGKLERVTFTDGARIRAVFPKTRMLDMYVETVAGIGAEQGEVGKIVAAHVRNRLGLN